MLLMLGAVDGHLWGLSKPTGALTATDTHWVGTAEYDWPRGVYWGFHCWEETQCKFCT